MVPESSVQGLRILNPRAENPRTKDPRIEDPVHGLEFCQFVALWGDLRTLLSGRSLMLCWNAKVELDCFERTIASFKAGIIKSRF